MNGAHVRGKVNISGWNLECVMTPPDHVGNWVLSAAQEVIEIAIKREGVLVYLSGTDNDPFVSVHCLLPLADGIEDPVYSVNLRDLVMEAIDGARNFTDDLVSAEGRPELERIRDVCRECAGLIESALMATDHAQGTTP